MSVNTRAIAGASRSWNVISAAKSSGHDEGGNPGRVLRGAVAGAARVGAGAGGIQYMWRIQSVARLALKGQPGAWPVVQVRQ